MQGVYVGGDTDKLGLVDEPIRRGAYLPLGNEFIEGRSRNAELAGRLGLREFGHGWAS
jgi:hypothetical protein